MYITMVYFCFILKKYFKKVQCESYNDALYITEVEPLYRYNMSCHGNQEEVIVEKKENYRNGYSKKILRSSFGNVEIEIPRDRNTEFNPVIVPKHTRNIFELEKQIIKLYTEKNTCFPILNWKNHSIKSII